MWFFNFDDYWIITTDPMDGFIYWIVLTLAKIATALTIAAVVLTLNLCWCALVLSCRLLAFVVRMGFKLIAFAFHVVFNLAAFASRMLFKLFSLPFRLAWFGGRHWRVTLPLFAGCTLGALMPLGLLHLPHSHNGAIVARTAGELGGKHLLNSAKATGSATSMLATLYQQSVRDLTHGHFNDGIAETGQLVASQETYSGLAVAALWRAEGAAVSQGQSVVVMELLSEIVSVAQREGDWKTADTASYLLSLHIRQIYAPLTRSVAGQRWSQAGAGADHIRYLRLGGLNMAGTGMLVKAVFLRAANGAVFGLDGHTGRVLWRTSLRGKVAGDVTAIDGMVYVPSADGMLYALDDRNGHSRWHFSTGSSVASPIVAGNTMYVTTSGGQVYALDPFSGHVRWQESIAGRLHGSPTAVGQSVLVAAGGDLYALNAGTGLVRWQAALGDGRLAAPVIQQGSIYVGNANGRLFALDQRTGHAIWTSRLPNAVRSLTLSGPTLYALTGTGWVYALDIHDGQIRWATPVTSTPGAAIAAFGNGIYFGAADGQVYAMNAANGATIWHTHTEGAITAAPALADGVLYIGSHDHWLYALSIRNGERLWRTHTGGLISSAPAVVGF